MGGVTLPSLTHNLPLSYAVISDFIIDPLFLLSSLPSLPSVPRVLCFHGASDVAQKGSLPANVELHDMRPQGLSFTHPGTGNRFQVRGGRPRVPRR
jgi:hypothetical protein